MKQAILLTSFVLIVGWFLGALISPYTIKSYTISEKLSIEEAQSKISKKDFDIATYDYYKSEKVRVKIKPGYIPFTFKRNIIYRSDPSYTRQVVDYD